MTSDPQPCGADRVCKVLVVGDYSVGKTSLIRQLTCRTFGSQYGVTVGVEFHNHQVGGMVLQLWDIAGHERFGSMTRQYYRYASAAVVVADCTREDTLQTSLRWKADIEEKLDATASESFISEHGALRRELPIVLVANKWDLPKRCVTKESLGAFAAEHKFTLACTSTATKYESALHVFDLVAAELSKIPSTPVGSIVGSPGQVPSQASVSLGAPYRRRPLNQQASKGKRRGCCSS